MTGLIAHEWIERAGGSENVLEAIATLYPDADLITPWNNAPERFPDRNVRELWLAGSPLRNRKALSVPFLTAAWRTAVPKNVEYDWIIASSHMFSHHVRPRGRNAHAPKLVYAHTPARYVWTPALDERGSGLAARVSAAVLRPIDRRRAKEPTAIAANSAYVQERIRFAWDRDAEVIHPPVDVEAIQAVADWRERLGPEELRQFEGLPSSFILGASRFIPYKQLDLVIRSAEEVGLPAVIAGDGPEREHLQSIADEVSVPVTFITGPSTPMLYALYQAASVFVFPPIEDFGIMPVEAIAAGTPVVAAGIGGSLETVTDGLTGAHFEAHAPESVARAIRQALELPSVDRIHAARFSQSAFRTHFAGWVRKSLS